MKSLSGKRASPHRRAARRKSARRKLLRRSGDSAKQAIPESERRLASENADLIRLHELSALLATREEHYRTLFTSMSEGFALGEALCGEDGQPRDFRFLEANDAFVQQSGLTREILGKPMREVLPALEEVWVERYCGVALGGDPVRFASFNRDTNRHYDVFCYSPGKGRFAILFRDVTQAKQAEEELRQAHERALFFSNALTGSSQPFVSGYPDGRLMFFNQAFVELTGYAEEELRKASWAKDLTPLEWREPEARVLEELQRTGQPQLYQKEYVRRDGTRIPVEIKVHLVRDQQGQPEYYYAFVTDITTRKAAEAALQLAHKRLKFHIENSPLAVIEFDPELRLIFWSSGATRIFGWEATEVLGKQMWDMPWLFEEDIEKVKAVFASMLSGTKPRTIGTNPNRRKDGTVVWCEWYNSSLHDLSGKMQSIFSLVLDVTERKRAEEALRESEQRFRMMADGTPLIIWVHNAKADLQFVNCAYCEFFGVTSEQILGADWRPLIHPEDVPNYVKVFLECHRQRKSFHAQARVRIHDGRWRWIESYGEPRFSESGEYLGIAGSSVDITERKEFQAELERLVQERTAALKETTDQLNAFVYTLAHDLRAPLRAQVAFATILLEDFGEALGPEGKDFAQRIADSAERQGLLLGDLLKHVSLSREDLPLEPVDLPKALKQAQADLIMEVQQKQASISFGPLESRVIANSASLHLILTNLLSNALKFVPPGVKPQVRVWTEPRELPLTDGRTGPGLGQGGGKMVRIWVEDNGLGIRADYMNKLFGVFQRLHAGPQYPGTGIGLAIVKKAAERMGGRVGVESEEGKGSRFWVELKAG